MTEVEKLARELDQWYHANLSLGSTMAWQMVASRVIAMKQHAAKEAKSK